MRIYVSGPMRGLPWYNFKAFDDACADLYELGHTPVSPAENSRRLAAECGYDPSDEAVYAKIPIETYMEDDIRAISHVDAVVLLHGWEKSTGAKVEVAYARFRKIPVWLFDDFKIVSHLKACMDNLEIPSVGSLISGRG